MCGICGKLNFRSRCPVEAALLERMAGTMIHRGPDDEGFHLDGTLGLGFRRLSIIDLSGGHQPLSNEDGCVWVIFNGEIYNFQDLRRDLEAAGHQFRTHSDTETIVHAYEEWGDECVQRFNGMFAFAIWDSRKQRLLLARDRLGVKPLYYALTDDGIVFGSELKAVVADPLVPRDIDTAALAQYFLNCYISAPRTIYRGVRKLRPGHLLVCERGAAREASYWDLAAVASEPLRGTLDDYCAQVRALFTDAVRLRMIADVPVGLFLSGGMDSSCICTTFKQLATGATKTFAVGFEEASYSEAAFARAVAARVGTEHYEIIVRSAEVPEVLSRLVRSFDEPFADSSAIPVYYVSQLAREHVTVALSGDGGDEIFGGYETYIATRLVSRYQRLPHFVRERVVEPLVYRLPVSHGKISLEHKLKRFISCANRSPVHAHASWRTYFMSHELNALLSPEAINGAGAEEHFARYDDYAQAGRDFDPFNQLMYLDLMAYLPEDMLVKVDRMTMANSLEGREPFLDYRLVELAMRIPGECKIRRGQTKFLLRQAFRDALPADIRRRRKAGFNVPMPVWLAGPLKEMTHDLLGSRAVRDADFFQPAYVQRILTEHERQVADHSHKLYALLTFFLWWEMTQTEDPFGQSLMAVGRQ